MNKELKSFDPKGTIPYDVRINHQINKVIAKGKINPIKSQSISISKK